MKIIKIVVALHLIALVLTQTLQLFDNHQELSNTHHQSSNPYAIEDDIWISDSVFFKNDHRQQDPQKHLPLEKVSNDTTDDFYKSITLIKDPTTIEVLVNKNYQLPQDYVPKDLVKSTLPQLNTGTHYIQKQAYLALTQLFEDALNNELSLVVVSAYRSYQTQKSLYQHYVTKHGQQKADQFSARAGHSEHQLGLAIDVSTVALKGVLTVDLSLTLEGIFLQENSHTYGFIVRYPQDKTSITGYTYEPWHLRYVGIDLALQLYQCQCVMEEWFDL